MSNKKNAIIGIGEVPTGTYPDRSPWEILYDICIQAVKNAGIHKNDIGKVITVAPQARPQLTAEISFGMIPEELGLKGCKDVRICNASGASISNGLRLAGDMKKLVFGPLHYQGPGWLRFNCYNRGHYESIRLGGI